MDLKIAIYLLSDAYVHDGALLLFWSDKRGEVKNQMSDICGIH